MPACQNPTPRRMTVWKAPTATLSSAQTAAKASIATTCGAWARKVTEATASMRSGGRMGSSQAREA